MRAPTNLKGRPPITADQLRAAIAHEEKVSRPGMPVLEGLRKQLREMETIELEDLGLEDLD